MSNIAEIQARNKRNEAALGIWGVGTIIACGGAWVSFGYGLAVMVFGLCLVIMALTPSR